MSDTEFEFIVEDVEPFLQLRIPGDNRGPDVCIPDSSEQEAWLDSRPDLVVRVWDCMWRFIDPGAKERFLLMLRDR